MMATDGFGEGLVDAGPDLLNALVCIDPMQDAHVFVIVKNGGGHRIECTYSPLQYLCIVISPSNQRVSCDLMRLHVIVWVRMVLMYVIGHGKFGWAVL